MKRIILVVIFASGIAVPAQADPYPHRKPGLWQLTATMTGSRIPPMTSRYCIDATTESALIEVGQGAMKNMCSRHDVHVVGGQGTIDSVCKFGKSTQTTHTIISFSGNTAYHSETQSHMQPPMFGSGDRTSITDAKWVGPCPADMKPGDVVMANGMRMNINPNAH